MQARRAAILGAIALATIGIVALAIRLDDPPAAPAGERASVPRRVEGSEPSLSFESGSSDSPGSDRAAEIRSASPELPPVASGALRLQFVSALDGKPVAGLPFVVHRERGGDKVLASGTSDSQGRAEVRDLEENVILVETVRRAPFASRVEACWLRRAETKELVVRLDAGARVTGRVVDDLRRPVEGAEILVESDSPRSERRDLLDREDASAVTGPDGRFAVDHLAVRPRGVWIVDAEARPERWDPAVLHIRKDVSVASATADVRPGETLDIGDVLLERCTILGGVVLDAQRRPLRSAIVSGRGGRRPTPGPGATRTDADGRFELVVAPRHASLAVQAPSGQRQVFGVPALPPGERRDDLVLEMRAITMLEIELRDARGERVTGPGPAARGGAMQSIAFHKRRGFGPRAVVVVRLDDDANAQVTTDADDDGIFRFEFEEPPERMRELTLHLAGYEAVHDRIEGAVAATTRLAYVLAEIPGLRLRIRRAPGEAAEIERTTLWLQTCLGAPESRQHAQDWPCCGLGAFLSFTWEGEPREFVFPAGGPRAFWVYLRGASEDRGLVDLASFGPFAGGPNVHEIAIDPALLEGVLRSDAEAPKTPPRPAILQARIVDVRTREPIAGASLGARGMSTSGSFWFPNSTAGADGRIDRAEVPPGTWTIVASVSRYRLAEIPDVELVEGGVRDLGTIELEPIPAFSGRVVRADGSSPGGACWVRARIAGNPSVETDEEGRFRLFADVPDRVAVDLFELLPSAGQDDRGVQRVLVEGWTIDVERELELAPWQRVEVRIGGPATDLPESSLVLWVCPAPDEPHGTCDHRDGFPRNHVPFLAASEVDPTEERRVFRFRTAPGRYQVYGRDLLHEVPAEVIEVRESDDLQVFELSSR